MYDSKSAVLKRRGLIDPRTKIALTLILAVFVLGGLGGEKMRFIRPFLSTIPFLLLLAEKKYLDFLKGMLMVAAGYGALFIMPRFTGATAFILLLIGGFITKFAVTVVMGSYLISTTHVSEFVRAMEKMHVPREVTIPFSVMFRFFPTILEEKKNIDMAMTMRDIRMGGKRAGEMIEYRMVPLLASCVRIGDELSASALTRGLGADRNRTSICRIGFRAQDYLLLAVCAGVIVIFIRRVLV